ncbi:decaprenyl-phosphate phosphoribosyltransferase [bacterium E08(2017)]|nr:decaprenyl-phosphate phosphoribosyltransferase [bacterium E08(2017)]
MTEPGEKKPLNILTVARTLRVNQWTKNGIVFAAFLFAFWDSSSSAYKDITALVTVLPAVALFCIASSGIYVLNDIRDIEADRNHPKKKFRPIAAGLISIPQAWIISCVLLAAGILGSMAINLPFAGVITAYIVLQLAYSLGLKHLALFDIFMIATGFVLRAIAGAVAIHVIISPWLLLCTFLLALFLATCKRRHEKIVLSDLGNNHRASLEKYDAHLLDQLIAILSGATVVAYAMYTLAPETVEKFETSALGFTIPFVMFGIFRYLDLVYRHEKGDRPEKILLTDLPIMVNMLLYLLVVVAIFMLK